MFRRGTFIPEFEEVAFSLKKNDIAPPALSPLGFHIIRLNDRVGEKIDASHILFPLSVQDNDVDRAFNFLDRLKNLGVDELLIDSLSLSSKGSYWGVFSGVPKENIAPSILQKLD